MLNHRAPWLVIIFQPSQHCQARMGELKPATGTGTKPASLGVKTVTSQNSLGPNLWMLSMCSTSDPGLTGTDVVSHPPRTSANSARTRFSWGNRDLNRDLSRDSRGRDTGERRWVPRQTDGLQILSIIRAQGETFNYLHQEAILRIFNAAQLSLYSVISSLLFKQRNYQEISGQKIFKAAGKEIQFGDVKDLTDVRIVQPRRIWWLWFNIFRGGGPGSAHREAERERERERRLSMAWDDLPPHLRQYLVMPTHSPFEYWNWNLGIFLCVRQMQHCSPDCPVMWRWNYSKCGLRQS